MKPDRAIDFFQTEIKTYTPQKQPPCTKWNPHPEFKGISLMHLLTAKQTSNKLSAHVVKANPDCTLQTHTHTTQWELHEVISGTGTAIINGEKTNYSPGTIVLIPANTPHSVQAGATGLLLMAKFFPPLI